MKKIMLWSAAFSCALALNAAQPQIPFTTSSGTVMQRLLPTDGRKAEVRDGIVAHIPGDKTPKHLFFRSMLELKPALKSSFAPEDALLVTLRVEKDTRIRVRWRKSDKTYIDMPVPELPLTGKKEFQSVTVPLPEATGIQFTV